MVTAIILAGGQGRRMGGANKALLRLGEQTFLERQLAAAASWSDEVVIVYNGAASTLLPAGCGHVSVVPDIYRGAGPLAGLHAGLAAASNDAAWVLGCDQPFADAAAARLLLEEMGGFECDAALPVLGDRVQPLHGVYRKKAHKIAERLLRQGERRLTALLDHISWRRVEEGKFAARGIHPSFASDVDTPEQHEEALDCYGREAGRKSDAISG
jgi:molybdopterin-guanine dinucleotide biosynthesis protein A